MKLFYFPGTCALAVHILLEEIGQPFELSLVNLGAGDQYKSPYVEMNPKGKIPALLRDDGTLLTESPAIAWFLGRSNPATGLMPESIEQEARLLELLDYMVATVHMRGFTRMFRPRAFAPSVEDEAAVVKAGAAIVESGLLHISETLGEQDFLLGSYSIADAALCYLEFWTVVRTEIDLPANLEAHYARMKRRPAVERALATEAAALQEAISGLLASDDSSIRKSAQRLLEVEAVARQRRATQGAQA